MVVAYQKNQNESVTMWWLHIRREYVPVFQIMMNYSKGMTQLQAIQANITIRKSYTRFIKELAPDDSHQVWKAFASMMINMIKSTEALSERRISESRHFYDSATVDYTEIQFHLLQNGVLQPNLV